jgi:hypothetical protein
MFLVRTPALSIYRVTVPARLQSVDWPSLGRADGHWKESFPELELWRGLRWNGDAHSRC